MSIGAKPVVVLTNQLDLAADDVIQRLESRGYPVRRVNSEDAVNSPAATWRSADECLHEIGSVWWRQFELSPDPADTSVVNAEELSLVRAQWRAWLSVLYSDEIPWVNPLWAARKAEDKITQLRTARLSGFTLPDSLLTNDRAVALDFAGNRPCVVKTLASVYFELSGEGFVYSHSLDDPSLADPKEWFRQPLIVQERVPGLDVRVIVVGDRVFGASCLSSALDWRTASGHVTWQRWSVPEQIRVKCIDYLARLRLRYAAFDFKDDGTAVWFLEANQAGEWAFLDRPLRLGVAEALTDFLVDLAQHS